MMFEGVFLMQKAFSKSCGCYESDIWCERKHLQKKLQHSFLQGLPQEEGAVARCPTDALFYRGNSWSSSNAVTITPSLHSPWSGSSYPLPHPPAHHSALWLLWPDLIPFSSGCLTDQKMQTHPKCMQLVPPKLSTPPIPGSQGSSASLTSST